MAFCPNCGSFMADGDKFCGNCGTVVAPAENSNAAPQQNAQTNYQQNYQPNFQQNYQPNFQQSPQQNPGMAYNQPYVPQAPSAFGIAMGQLGKELLSFLKNPVGTITKNRFEMSAIATYFFTGVITLLLVLQNFWKADRSRVYAKSSSSFPSDISIGGIKDLLNNVGLGGADAPGAGKIFLASLFFVIIMGAAIWGISLLLNAAFMKGQFTPVHALNVVSFAAIPYLACSLLATVFAYVDPNVEYMIYIAGVIGGLVLLYRAIGSNVNKSETTLFYSFMAAMAVIYLLNFIIFKVAGSSVGVFYNGVFIGIR